MDFLGFENRKHSFSIHILLLFWNLIADHNTQIRIDAVSQSGFCAMGLGTSGRPGGGPFCFFPYAAFSAAQFVF
jgi:hypothetical protein